jgi:hypothetical protein
MTYAQRLMTTMATNPNLPNIFRPNYGPPMTKAEIFEKKQRTQSLAAEAAHEAIERLVYWMRDTANPSVSLAATKELLDRAFGKVKDVDDKDSGQAALSNLNVQILFVDHDGRQRESLEAVSTTIDQPPQLTNQGE